MPLYQCMERPDEFDLDEDIVLLVNSFIAKSKAVTEVER